MAEALWELPTRKPKTDGANSVNPFKPGRAPGGKPSEANEPNHRLNRHLVGNAHWYAPTAPAAAVIAAGAAARAAIPHIAPVAEHAPTIARYVDNAAGLNPMAVGTLGALGLLGSTAIHQVDSVQRWRLCQQFHGQWDSHWGHVNSPKLHKPTLAANGVLRATITLPRNATWDQLSADVDIEGGTVPSSLELGRRWPFVGTALGTPEAVRIVNDGNTNHAKTRTLMAAYLGLPVPADVAFDPLAPAETHRIRLGWGLEGWEWWNFDGMNSDPNAYIAGRPGSGKGRALKWLGIQAVNAGFPVVILDGQGAPEHRAWERFGGVRVIAGSSTNPYRFVNGLIGLTNALNRIVAYRFEAMGDVESWAEMPRTWRRRNPRILILADELTVGLEPDGTDEFKDLLEEALAAVIRALRGQRKYGINWALFDQITYASTLPKSATGMCGRRVVMGNLAKGHRQMAADTADLPVVPGHPGSACTVRIGGDTHIPTMSFPNVTKDVLDDHPATPAHISNGESHERKSTS